MRHNNGRKIGKKVTLVSQNPQRVQQYDEEAASFTAVFQVRDPKLCTGSKPLFL
jgi:hypothetical protein